MSWRTLMTAIAFGAIVSAAAIGFLLGKDQAHSAADAKIGLN